jgi:hypothetical protein
MPSSKTPDTLSFVIFCYLPYLAVILQMQDVVTVVVLESGWAYCLWYAGGSLLSVVRWLDAAGWWSVGVDLTTIQLSR